MNGTRKKSFCAMGQERRVFVRWATSKTDTVNGGGGGGSQLAGKQADMCERNTCLTSVHIKLLFSSVTSSV